MKGILRILIVTALMIIIGAGMFIFSSCDDQAESALPHEHLWGDWEVVKISTCTEDGEMALYCSLCGYTKSVTLDKKGHTEGNPEITREPTCTQNGEMQTSCTVCGYINITEIEKKGHTNSNWEIVREPTCETPGKRVIRCLVCDDIVKFELIRILPHTYGGWVVASAPTCTEDGKMHNECTECGYTDKQTIPATGHSLNEPVTEREPTCTSNGIMHTDCTVCGESFSKEIPATGHTDGEWIIVSTPTCTEEGEKHTLCTVCGEVTDTETLPAAHVFNDNEECTLCGIKLSPEGQRIVFEFGDNGAAEHRDGFDLEKEISYTFEGYTLNFTDMYKIFGPAFDAQGNSCIKVGTKEFTGTLSFTVPDEVYAVIIRIAKYKDYESKVIINGTEYTLTKNSHDGEYDRIIVDTSITKTVTISTVDGGTRAMMNSIVFVLAPDAGECQHSGGNATCQNKATCTICGEEYGELGEHSYENRICTVCGAVQYSEGLEYTIIDDKTCAVTGIGTCTDTDIVIPPVAPDDRTVVYIGKATGNCNFSSMTSIFIPSTVTGFYDWELIGCETLRSITVDENNEFFKSIDGNLYTKDGKTLLKYSYRGVTEFTVPYGVTHIGEFAFYSMGNNTLEVISLPDTIVSIGGGAFAYCLNLASIEIPSSVTVLNASAFVCCNLDFIVIPSSVTCIKGSFDPCFWDTEWNIYYKGTAAEWELITIDDPDSYGNAFDYATICYYSETEPTTEGNFWHWVDGEPTVWK